VTPARRSTPRIALETIVLVGVLDIIYAIGMAYFRSGTTPQRLLQGIASGAIGRAAFDGGWRTAAIGLGFHFLIVIVITLLYVGVASRVRALVRHPVVLGSLYGIVIYIVMNYVVIPMSLIGPRPRPPLAAMVPGILVHMFIIGTLIALGARRALR